MKLIFLELHLKLFSIKETAVFRHAKRLSHQSALSPTNKHRKIMACCYLNGAQLLRFNALQGLSISRATEPNFNSTSWAISATGKEGEGSRALRIAVVRHNNDSVDAMGMIFGPLLAFDNLILFRILHGSCRLLLTINADQRLVRSEETPGTQRTTVVSRMVGFIQKDYPWRTKRLWQAEDFIVIKLITHPVVLDDMDYCAYIASAYQSKSRRTSNYHCTRINWSLKNSVQAPTVLGGKLYIGSGYIVGRKSWRTASTTIRRPFGEKKINVHRCDFTCETKSRKASITRHQCWEGICRYKTKHRFGRAAKAAFPFGNDDFTWWIRMIMENAGSVRYPTRWLQFNLRRIGILSSPFLVRYLLLAAFLITWEWWVMP